VNVADLDKISGSDPVTPETLMQNGLIKNLKAGVKILGTGELKSKLTVRAHKFSKSAVDKIQAAGGKAEVI
jgi:large subunit ribosomal protein L15